MREPRLEPHQDGVREVSARLRSLESLTRSGHEDEEQRMRHFALLDRSVMRLRRPTRPRTESNAQVGTPRQANLPRDFLDELAYELEASEQQARWQAERLAVLSELHRIATATAHRLGRPVTVLDIIESADDESERNRLTALVNRLRA